MDPLMVSISGIRGIVGTSLTPNVILDFVAAFGTYQAKRYPSNNTIIVGRDSRVSGPWIESIVVGLLQSQGFNVTSVGIVPTPTVQYLVIKHKAVGGVIITSSHNPVQWNGLKFVDSDGLFLSPQCCKEMYEIAQSGNPKLNTYANYSQGGRVEHSITAIQEHIDAILSLSYIQVDLVKAKKFKVVIDAINGAGSVIMRQLCQDFGCQVVMLNEEQTGLFNHEPEPIGPNLTQLCAAIVAEKADLGIAVDPDVDRCVLIDEHGKPLGEEYTLAIAVNFFLGHCGRRGVVCNNLSSSRVVNDIAKQYESTVVSTPVGEIHVASKMVELKAVIGGEGNGGVMLPDIHIGRDAPVAAALILQQLALFGGTLSALKQSLPQWEIVKLKTPTQGIDAEKAMSSLQAEWLAKGAQINTADGLRIDTDTFWVHLRRSNTEPIIRVIGEAKTADLATDICEQIMAQLQSLGKQN